MARLHAIDAGYISSVLLACRVSGAGRRRSTLPLLRSVLRISSPELRRQIIAHRYVARLNRVAKDDKLHPTTRTRAQAAREALPRVPGLLALVPDLDNPWSHDLVNQARTAEWRRASLHTRRPVPPPAQGPNFLPPAARLCEQWARALAARYHCTTFPILHRALPRAGPRPQSGKPVAPLHDRAVLSLAEQSAMTTLELLHEAHCTPHQLAEITTALRTLRPRERWSRPQGARSP